MNLTYAQGRANRKIAEQNGDPYFLTKACRNCGDNRRYTKGAACPTCSTEKGKQHYREKNYNQVVWRENRRRAKLQGTVTYNGKACQTCNNTERYTCNKACVHCHKLANKHRAKLKVKRSVSTLPKKPRSQEEAIQSLLNGARIRARKRMLPFDLSLEDIQIPEKCPVLGIPLSFGGDRSNSPSIDRFDNDKGYTKDNIRIISTRANLLKSNATLEELLRIVEWMSMEMASSP